MASVVKHLHETFQVVEMVKGVKLTIKLLP